MDRYDTLARTSFRGQRKRESFSGWLHWLQISTWVIITRELEAGSGHNLSCPLLLGDTEETQYYNMLWMRKRWCSPTSIKSADEILARLTEIALNHLATCCRALYYLSAAWLWTEVANPHSGAQLLLLLLHALRLCWGLSVCPVTLVNYYRMLTKESWDFSRVIYSWVDLTFQ